MSEVYPDSPVVPVVITWGGTTQLDLSPTTRAWATEYQGRYTLMIDDTAYPLAPMRAREDDPPAWAGAVAQAEQVLEIVRRLRAAAAAQFPARFDLTYVVPDVALMAVIWMARPGSSQGRAGCCWTVSGCCTLSGSARWRW